MADYELSRSYADFEFYDNIGNRVGWSNIVNNLKPSDRGNCAVDCSRLIPQWDNYTYSEYNFELNGNNMLLITLSGEKQLWERT